MDTKAVSERIKIARKEHYLTQRELAEAVGCTTQYISAVESAAKIPTLETFVAIAAALRVPADVLLQDVLPDWWENWEKEIDRVTDIKNYIAVTNSRNKGMMARRIPLIPAITDTAENLSAIADFFAELKIEKTELLPYNPTWYSKADKLGVSVSGDIRSLTAWQTDEKMASVKSIFQARKIEC